MQHMQDITSGLRTDFSLYTCTMYMYVRLQKRNEIRSCVRCGVLMQASDERSVRSIDRIDSSSPFKPHRWFRREKPIQRSTVHVHVHVHVLCLPAKVLHYKVQTHRWASFNSSRSIVRDENTKSATTAAFHSSPRLHKNGERRRDICLSGRRHFGVVSWRRHE